MTVSFNWSPSLPLVGAEFGALAGRLRSFRIPLNRAIRQVVIPSFMANFDAEGRPAWPPLSAETIATRLNRGFGAGPILQRSGRLKAVMGQVNIWTVNSQEAYIHGLPSEVSYGGIHDSGTRPFAYLQPEDGDKIERIFEEYIIERIGL